jgi:hypothetical protein
MKDTLMKFLRFWNRFFFKLSYNIFDLLVLIIVVQLIAHDSWWWALVYIPTTMISVIMQRKVEAENANS